jgi:phenylalanyl-tRNA synthetase beta chain
MFNRKSEIIKNLNICQCKVNIKKQILKFNTLASMIGLSFNKIDKINSFNTFKLLKFVFFKKKASFLIIKIPTYRSDIYREIDLVSEVIRINKLKNLIKRIRLKSERKVRVVNFNNNLVYKISNKFRNILVYNGFSEFINSSLISRKKNLNSPFYKDREEIKIKNPLGINTLCMRQSLIPSLLNNVFFNNSNMISDVRAFEVGSIFRKLKRNEKIWSKNKSLKMFAFEGLCIAFVV